MVLSGARQPDNRVSDPRPGEGQRRAGHRVAAGALAAVRAVSGSVAEEVAPRPSRDAATRGRDPRRSRTGL